MRNPLVGRVTSEFNNNRVHPVSGRRIPHWGIDIGAPAGTSPQAYVGAPIRAAYAGTVERAGFNVVPHRTGYTAVIRNPDGECQIYCHLNRIDVRVGQRVAEGQVLGGMGATGNVTGPHLHFETHNRGSNASNGYSRVRNPRLDFRAAGITPGVDLPQGSHAPSASSSSSTTVRRNMTTPREVWRWRGTDHVNENAVTKDFQLSRAYQYALTAPQRTWSRRGLDYVNKNPITKDSQLARAHQYSWQSRNMLQNLEKEVAELKKLIQEG